DLLLDGAGDVCKVADRLLNLGGRRFVALLLGRSRANQRERSDRPQGHPGPAAPCVSIPHEPASLHTARGEPPDTTREPGRAYVACSALAHPCEPGGGRNLWFLRIAVKADSNNLTAQTNRFPECSFVVVAADTASGVAASG